MHLVKQCRYGILTVVILIELSDMLNQQTYGKTFLELHGSNYVKSYVTYVFSHCTDNVYYLHLKRIMYVSTRRQAKQA